MKIKSIIFSLLLLVSSCSIMAQEEKESTYRAINSVGISIANNSEKLKYNTDLLTYKSFNQNHLELSQKNKKNNIKFLILTLW